MGMKSMFFDDDLNAVFGKPNYSVRSQNSTRALFRQIARQNPAFRKFARDPLGRSILNTASLLARLSFESTQSAGGEVDRVRNSATRVGRSKGDALQFAAADVLLSALEDVVNKAFSNTKVTTTTLESERSKQTQKLWNSSRSDQSAMLARMVQKGLGEL
jgi:hypothetical protein